MKVMTLEEYLISKGVSDGWYSDLGFADTNTGRLKGRQFKETEDLMRKRSVDYFNRKKEIIEEYNKLLEKGEIRKPTHYEETLKISKGDPKSPQVQSAKRLLKIMEKKGMHLEKGE